MTNYILSFVMDLDNIIIVGLCSLLRDTGTYLPHGQDEESHQDENTNLYKVSYWNSLYFFCSTWPHTRTL